MLIFLILILACLYFYQLGFILIKIILEEKEKEVWKLFFLFFILTSILLLLETSNLKYGGGFLEKFVVVITLVIFDLSAVNFIYLFF